MRHPFEVMLDKIEPFDAETPLRPFSASVSSLAVAAAEIARPHSGVHSLYEFAADWTPEADPPPPPPPPPELPKPSARAEDIAGELGLGRLQSSIDIAQARRRFMWDNHPDRHKDLDRDLANRRVAIANMLLDRKLSNLARRRRGR